MCDPIAKGLLNKQIAGELGISEKTIKVHRGRVMRKLDIDSVAALVWLLSRLPKSGAASERRARLSGFLTQPSFQSKCLCA